MAVIIGADKAGTNLKRQLKSYLIELGKEVVDVSKKGQDFVDVTLAVAKK